MLANSQIEPLQTELDALDRQIIEATQRGLPLTKDPYQDVAQQLDISTEVLIQRMQSMQQSGIIRRAQQLAQQATNRSALLGRNLHVVQQLLCVRGL